MLKAEDIVGATPMNVFPLCSPLLLPTICTVWIYMLGFENHLFCRSLMLVLLHIGLITLIHKIWLEKTLVLIFCNTAHILLYSTCIRCCCSLVNNGSRLCHCVTARCKHQACSMLKCEMKLLTTFHLCEVFLCDHIQSIPARLES